MSDDETLHGRYDKNSNKHSNIYDTVLDDDTAKQDAANFIADNL